MNKIEFKKQYSFFREVNRNFNEKLQNGNFPCGYDDMLCENFNDNSNKWLDENPVIKAVVGAYNDGDYLEARMDLPQNLIKGTIKYRMNNK